MSNSRRRGAMLIVVMWVSLALAAVVLTTTYAMRVEGQASANRLAQTQAEAALRGAEQFLRSVVEQEITSPGTADSISFEARQIGDCYVWFLKPDPDNAQGYAYGLCDEAGKLDLNTASSSALALLPGITQDVVDSIVDWRDPDFSVTGDGAEEEYYLALPEPYHCKNAPLESVDELALIKGVTTEILFGYDRNRNSVLDAREMQAGGTAMQFNVANGAERGIFPFVTVHGVLATRAAGGSGSSLTDVNSASQNRLQTVLKNAGLSNDRVNLLLQLMFPNRQPRARYSNVFDWYYRLSLPSDEFSKLYPLVTVGTTGGAAASAKINVYTAPRQVLACLPGLQSTDVEALLSARQSNTTRTNLAWVADAMSAEAKKTVTQWGGMITGASKVYSGDIVAVSPDGRAFVRCRVIVDGSQSPPAIVYRRDLTSSGWPLPAEIRTALRSGQGLGTQTARNGQGSSTL